MVVASGRIEGREITVAPKDIQARIKRLFVDEGDRVTQGQLLGELDAAPLEARLATVRGNLAGLDAQIAEASLDVDYTAKNIQAAIAAATAGLSNARARLAHATAILATATVERNRVARLLEVGAVSQRELDQAEMIQRTSVADVDAAQEDLHRAEANLEAARATADTVALKRQRVRVLQEARRAAAGQLQEVEATLAERHVIAPTSGTIMSRPVEVGDVVTPGSAIFRMVDMNRLYVKVYIAERDIGKLRLGDAADVAIDAFPNRTFHARISRISDQAEFTPKNVETAEERLKLVFGVELALLNPDGLLKPGMPADCTIHWTPTAASEGGHGS
jgi:HlyD family secretion protein